MTGKPIVLSLCDRTGYITVPWARAGFECWLVDLAHPPGVKRVADNVYLVGADVRTFLPPRKDYAITFAFPPCTDLAVSGARWFQEKGLSSLAFALDLVAACKDICEWTEGVWMLENPVSTLSTYWRKPDHTFDPYEYGGYLDPEGDSYSKRTCLWTSPTFNMPEKRPVVFDEKLIRDGYPKDERAEMRARTPMGFAQAVFEANSPTFNHA